MDKSQLQDALARETFDKAKIALRLDAALSELAEAKAARDKAMDKLREIHTVTWNLDVLL